MYCLFDENSTVAFLLCFAAWRLCILVRGDDVFWQETDALAVSCFVFGIQGASHLKEGGLFWLQQPNMGMKLKKIIKEIENNDESTITVDKANYIALLRWID